MPLKAQKQCFLSVYLLFQKEKNSFFLQYFPLPHLLHAKPGSSCLHLFVSENNGTLCTCSVSSSISRLCPQLLLELSINRHSRTLQTPFHEQSNQTHITQAYITKSKNFLPSVMQLTCFPFKTYNIALINAYLKNLILRSHNTYSFVNFNSSCSGISMFCHIIPCILTSFTNKLGMQCLCNLILINVVEVIPSQEVLEFNLDLTCRTELADLVHS